MSSIGARSFVHEREAVPLQTRQQIQMKRVFIEVQREEGRSAVILTIWLV